MCSSEIGHCPILVVEDNFLVRLTVVSCLEDAGFEVLEAENADEALALLQAGAAVQAVVTDIEMPGTMNGLVLAQIVRRQWPGLGVIVTSGRQQPAAEDLPAGSVFFGKPYPFEVLISTLQGFAA